MKRFILFTLILFYYAVSVSSCGVAYLQPALGDNSDENKMVDNYVQDEELYVCKSRSDLYLEPEYESTLVAKLNYPRMGHSSTLIDDDKIIIIGGYDNYGNFINEIEIYDHKDKIASLAGKLNIARYKHSAVKLLDGSILITGGYSEFGVLNNAEIYDPYTKKSKTINKMNYKRAEHRSFISSDERVYIIGGYDDKETPLKTVEIFDPERLDFSLSDKNLDVSFEPIISKNRYEHTETIIKEGVMLIIGGMDEKNILIPEIEELKLNVPKDKFIEILVFGGSPPYNFRLLKGNGVIDNVGQDTPLGVFYSQEVIVKVIDNNNKSNIVSFSIDILEE